MDFLTENEFIMYKGIKCKVVFNSLNKICIELPNGNKKMVSYQSIKNVE